MSVDGFRVGLERVARDLRALGRDFALVGGLAVSARGEPRFTRDADFAVAVVDDRDAERLISDLGYAIHEVIEQEATKRLSTLRAHGPDGLAVDLLFASSGIEPELVASATELTIARGLTLPVARIPHLIALKVLSESDQRLQDRIDLTGLIRAAQPAEIDEARALLALIESRGFARGKPLARILDGFLRR